MFIYGHFDASGTLVFKFSVDFCLFNSVDVFINDYFDGHLDLINDNFDVSFKSVSNDSIHFCILFTPLQYYQ